MNGDHQRYWMFISGQKARDGLPLGTLHKKKYAIITAN
jgi:hypothetical protein